MSDCCGSEFAAGGLQAHSRPPNGPSRGLALRGPSQIHKSMRPFSQFTVAKHLLPDGRCPYTAAEAPIREGSMPPKFSGGAPSTPSQHAQRGPPTPRGATAPPFA